MKPENYKLVAMQKYIIHNIWMGMFSRWGKFECMNEECFSSASCTTIPNLTLSNHPFSRYESDCEYDGPWQGSWMTDRPNPTSSIQHVVQSYFLKKVLCCQEHFYNEWRIRVSRVSDCCFTTREYCISYTMTGTSYSMRWDDVDVRFALDLNT